MSVTKIFRRTPTTTTITQRQLCVTSPAPVSKETRKITTIADISHSPLTTTENFTTISTTSTTTLTSFSTTYTLVQSQAIDTDTDTDAQDTMTLSGTDLKLTLKPGREVALHHISGKDLAVTKPSPLEEANAMVEIKSFKTREIMRIVDREWERVSHGGGLKTEERGSVMMERRRERRVKVEEKKRLWEGQGMRREKVVVVMGR